MPIRYTDLVSAGEGMRDFVVRKRRPPLSQLVALFLLVALFSIIFLVNVFDKSTVVFLLLLLIGGAGWYVIVHIQRSRDLVLATEFQNAMFASALGFNNKFCLIIKKEGNIVYMDRSFQTLFPDMLKENHLSIATLLRHGKVEAADKDKIFAAIERGVYDKVIFDIYGTDNKPQKILMSMEPILRPQGFTLLRCREFVEKRNTANDITTTTPAAPPQPENPLLSRSGTMLFSYIMDKMNMGVYMTDPTGNITYVNPTLEHWLTYKEGELLTGNLSLGDIIHQTNRTSGNFSQADYEGDVMLLKKVGGSIRAFINQKIIRDDSDKVLGCVALIHRVAESDTGNKRSLW